MSSNIFGVDKLRILALGCGGFIGSHFLDRLLAMPGVEVIGWDLDQEKIEHHLANPNFTMRLAKIDASAQKELRDDIMNVDWVVNLAAVCNPSQYNTEPLKTIYANFIEGYPIVEICAALKKPLMQFSTSEVYGRTISSYVGDAAYKQRDLYWLDADTSPMIMGPIAAQRWTYACAKQLLERLVYAYHKEQGMPFAILRPFNFFGPRMDYIPGIEGDGKPRVLASFLGALLNGTPIMLVDGGTAKRTITSIHDAIDAMVAIIAKPERSLNHFYNIGNPDNELSMRELAETMRKVYADLAGDDRYLSHPIQEVSGIEYYGEGYEDCDRRIMDIDPEKERLGWAPQRSIDEILRETMGYYFDKYSQRPTRLKKAS